MKLWMIRMEIMVNSSSRNPGEEFQSISIPIVAIQATAIISDSPNATLKLSHAILIKARSYTDTYKLTNYMYMYSEQMTNLKFKDTAGLMIDVKTKNLWEEPRSCLWKHLGQDNWSRVNDSVIAVIRIHLK